MVSESRVVLGNELSGMVLDLAAIRASLNQDDPDITAAVDELKEFERRSS